MSTAHDDLRRHCHLARELVSAVPETPSAGSPRRDETTELRSTPNGGGLRRARVLDRLSTEMQIVAAHITVIVDGVADCLEVAAGRDNAVNGPALSFVLRPALEIAGQVAWLLDDSIDGAARARRYLTWRFADLRQQQLLLRGFRASDGELQSARCDLDAQELSLLDEVTAAKWTAKSSFVSGRNFEAAALLDADGNREVMPKHGELVRLVSSSPSVYALLSSTAHGDRFGIMHGIEVAMASDESGQRDVRVAGFGVEPNTAIGLAVLAVSDSCRRLAGWNGVDSNMLHEHGLGLLRRAGFN